MKNFLQYFFASLLALGVFQIILFFFFIIFGLVLVASFGSFEEEHKAIGDKTVLVIDLNRSYPEYHHSQRFDNALWFMNLPKGNISITSYELRNVIEIASEDERIEGILLKCGAVGSSWSTSSSIRKSLDAFRKKGKFIISYGDVYVEKNYYIASIADSVYIHPQGVFEWNGLSARVTFYKKILESAGVDMQIYYAGNFKSATEPYRRTNLSPYNREQLREVLHTFNDLAVSSISMSRSIPVSTLKGYANDLAIFQASDALQYGMVDKMAILSEVEMSLKERMGVKANKDISYMTASEYKHSVPNKKLINYEFGTTSENEIALVYMNGAIGNGLQIDYDEYSELIQDLAADEDVKGVVLRVNSPGGSALVSESVLRELLRLKAKKNVVVSMGSVAASGGYYISCYADSIFVSPYTLTGSIGVFTMIPTAKELLTDKLKLSYDEVSTSPHASFESVLSRRFDDIESRKMQAHVDSIYSTFLDRVASGRNMSKISVHKVAQGRIWTGEDAIEKGLADAIGDENRAIKSAAAMAGLSDFHICRYPQRGDFLQELLTKIASTTATFTGIRYVANHPIVKKLYQISKIEEQVFHPQMALPYRLNY